jgi:hypothetical protein
MLVGVVSTRACVPGLTEPRAWFDAAAFGDP